MNASGIKFGLGVYTALFIVFLYGPLAVLAILSLQTGPEGGPQFPIIEWSTYWYKHLFGLFTGASVSKLFIGGIMPGLLMGVFLIITTWLIARRRNYPAGRWQGWREFWRGRAGSLFGSLVPGARTLSVQQWSLAVAQKVAGGDLGTSDVGLTKATVMLGAVPGPANLAAGHKLRALARAGAG